MLVLVGLGSNVGNRFDYLGAALWKLSYLLEPVKVSRVLESKALLPEGVPQEEGAPFLNMVVAGHSKLPALELLFEFKEIEKELGRQDRGYWGAREIDIDLLAMGSTVLEAEGLHLPHRHMLNRDFVMVPLCDVAPEWQYPVEGEFFGMSAAQIVAAKGFALNGDLRESEFAFR